MSVDFDPVRLRPSRRRLDPVVIGVVVVVVALAAAVVKPWEVGLVHRAAVTASSAPNAPAASIPTESHLPAAELAAIHMPTWADLAPIVAPHDGVGSPDHRGRRSRAGRAATGRLVCRDMVAGDRRERRGPDRGRPA